LKTSKGRTSSNRQAPLKPAKPPKAAVKKIKNKAAAGYDPLSPDRIRKIIEGLDQMYPGVTCALTHRNAWELLVATILSAQCTDVRVNMVTPELFKKYPTVQDFAALDPEDLQPDIRSTGFFRNKSKSLVGAARSSFRILAAMFLKQWTNC
jgi:endonuclease-3